MYQNGLFILMGIYHLKEYYFHLNNFGPLVKQKRILNTTSSFYPIQSQLYNNFIVSYNLQKIITRQLSQFFLVPFIHQSIPAAPRPPGLLRGICLPCQSQGWGICKFCTARGLGISQPRGYSQTFDTHAVSYQNITTQRILLEKTSISAYLSRTGKN